MLAIVLLINLLIFRNISHQNDAQNKKIFQVNYIQLQNQWQKNKQQGKNYSHLKEIIRKNNLKPNILNKHFLMNLTTSILPHETLIILIQVHKRIQNLESLIESLSNVRNINKTLILFSHDYYNQTINKLVKGIEFASVLQIFFPYMIQIYEKEFPGESLNDCPIKISYEKAREKNCTNWMHPDKYGNYRDFKQSQIKHHWLWKLSFIFDHLIYTKRIKNLNVLLLEEDFYVFPDILHVFNLLKQKFKNDSQSIISLSDTYIDHTKPDFQNSSNAYSICRKHLCTSAMIFTRNLWRSLKLNINQFCKRDDYNWDW